MRIISEHGFTNGNGGAGCISFPSDADIRTKPQNCQQEEWRNIEGFPGYMASSGGDIKSLKRAVPRILKPLITWDGYRRVSLSGRNVKISKLIAVAFHPNPDNKPMVLHRDGNPLNDSASNLYWGGYKENTADDLKHNEGRKVFLTPEMVRKVRRDASFTPKETLMLNYGLKRATLERLLRGWTHKPEDYWSIKTRTSIRPIKTFGKYAPTGKRDPEPTGWQMFLQECV